ncbi:OmpH family outer membrane protein [Rurimicrobium arvi]|uniref:OmpH family outer membrane protein n=1 Tax=Rurimicrobium arvi TaxID=2049916 RepID=A0ABP8MQE3_9BACT
MKKLAVDRIFIAIAVLVSTVALIISISPSKSDGPVYIDIGRLVGGYKFKKDMELEGQSNLYKIRNTVDSLKLINQTNPSPLLATQLTNAQNAFDKYQAYLEQDMTAKVWERLNPQLEEFGKEMGYRIIIGANGRGTVLYGSSSIDVTEKAIEFVNHKYEKGN